MHSQIACKDCWNPLDRYLGPALNVFLRAVRPLDVRQSTLNEAERSLLRQLVEQARNNGGPITASDFLASCRRLMNSAAWPNCGGACGRCEPRSSCAKSRQGP